MDGHFDYEEFLRFLSLAVSPAAPLECVWVAMGVARVLLPVPAASFLRAIMNPGSAQPEALTPLSSAVLAIYKTS